MADLQQPEFNHVVEEAIQAVINHYRQDVADGSLSFWEAWGLVQAAAGTFVHTVHAFVEISAVEKEKVVLDAVGRVFDAVIAPLDIPGVPEFMERTLVDPMMREGLMKLTKAGLSVMFGIAGWRDKSVLVLPRSQALPRALTATIIEVKAARLAQGASDAG